MNKETKSKIICLVKREIVPAVGCTEPAAVALAAAKTASLLEEEPDFIEVLLSANVLKNAMGVGIPGTGMIGLPITIALGTCIARPEKGLEVLKGFPPETLHQAKELSAEKKINIQLKEGVDKLYIEVKMRKADHTARTIIAGTHTNFILLEKDQEKLLDLYSPCEEKEAACCDEIKLTFDLVYRFSMESPLDEISFITKTAILNKEAADASFKGCFGHEVGRVIQSETGRKYLGNNIFSHMLAVTAAACDARMDGAMIPVMSNSGSGNQGIAATLPVVAFAEDMNATEEQLIRSLMLSHLLVIYIKQSLGRLSALCGCVVAATGAASAITYLMGGDKTQIGYAIKNMIGNITGMICDGAKPGCALKVSGGVSTAMLSALLAMENKVVSPLEGIIETEVDKTITNLTTIGSEGMIYTDKMVLDIMTGKP